MREIYSSFFPKIKSYILNNSGTLQDAEDVFQAVLTVIFVGLKNGKLYIGSSFEGYIYTCCKNAWKREASKKWVTNYKEYLLKDEETPLAQFFIEQQYWDVYIDNFQRLSENCKTILNMAFSKIPYSNIKDKLGYASELVVKQRVFKCKAKLAKLIKVDHRFKDF